MRLPSTMPIVLIFVCRAAIPLALATLGAWAFMASTEAYSLGQLGRAMSNGLWLFGSAGVCAGWAIERAFYNAFKRRYLRDLRRLQGSGALTEDERVAISLIEARLEEDA